MKNHITGIIFAIIILISFTMGGYFFSQTGITINNFLTINFSFLLDSLISINFLLFCIISSIGLGIMLSLGSFYEIKKATIISLSAYLISITVSIVLFNLYDFTVPLFITAFSIPLCLKSIQKAKEYKVFPILRAGIYSTEKFFLVISLIFFFTLLFISINQMNYLETNFSNEIVGSTIGNNMTLSDQFSLQLGQAIATNQSKTIELMLEQEEIKRLIDQEIPDALIYNQKLLAYKTAYNDEEYALTIAGELKNNKLDLGKEIIDKFPIIKLMAKYAFLIYSFSASILVIFIGNIIIKNLAGLVFAGIIKYYPTIEKTEKKA